MDSIESNLDGVGNKIIDILEGTVASLQSSEMTGNNQIIIIIIIIIITATTMTTTVVIIIMPFSIGRRECCESDY